MAYRRFEDEDLPVRKPANEKGWYQGVYKVRNYRKYMSNKPPIFRSSWEYNLMYVFDTNDNILRWGSEVVEIPYINPIDNAPHRYFTDFFVEFIDINGKFIQWIIEVKPLSKLNPPKQKNKTRTRAYQMNEYMINKAKWNAADLYCSKKGWQFKILTEEEIKALNRYIPM